jgi:hypothetical protein
VRFGPLKKVGDLVQRVVKWGNMPLDSWLQDVIKDEAVLYQLRQTLGIDGTPSADYDTDTSSEETTESTSDTW